MSDSDQKGVYAWEDGKSGITRKAPPEWYAPRIDRREMKALTKRKNSQGFIFIGLWLVLLGVLGWASAITMASPWSILLFFLYGNVFANCDSRWHECMHGTVFRTPFLNEIVFFFCATGEFRDVIFTRWSHVTHHSYTIDREVDLEISAPRPVKLRRILPDFFFLVSGPIFAAQLVLHSLGIPTKNARRVVPESDFLRMFWAARACLALHLAAIALAIALGSWLPVLLYTLPRFYGGVLFFLYAFTQHAGLAENVTDHRLNTRTVHLNPLFSFLYMKMEHHIEHHIFPNVPFHALPRLHKAVLDQMPRPYKGLWDAYRSMIPVLLRQRHDADYYLKRELPEGA